MPKCSSWGLFHRLVHALRQAISALSPNFEKFFCGVKVWCGAQKIGVGRKPVNEIDPRLHLFGAPQEGMLWYKNISKLFVFP